jgi:hypothetical protein
MRIRPTHYAICTSWLKSLVVESWLDGVALTEIYCDLPATLEGGRVEVPQVSEVHIANAETPIVRTDD